MTRAPAGGKVFDRSCRGGVRWCAVGLPSVYVKTDSGVALCRQCKPLSPQSTQCYVGSDTHHKVTVVCRKRYASLAV